MKPTPDPIEFDYEWVAGTMPPPHHYRYTIRGVLAAAAQAEVVFVPGYAFESPPRWVSTFTVDAAAAAALERVIEQQAVWTRAWKAPDDGRSRAVGGSQRTLRLSRGGSVVSVPADLTPEDRAAIGEVEEAVRALVPEPLWRDLRARHAAHMANAGR